MFWPIRAESSGSRFPFPLGVFKRTSEHRCWARTMPARVETSICRLVPAVSVVIRSARNGSWPDINDRSSCSVACESTPLIRPLTPNQACDKHPRRRSPIPSGSGGLRPPHRCCHGDIQRMDREMAVTRPTAEAHSAQRYTHISKEHLIAMLQNIHQSSF